MALNKVIAVFAKQIGPVLHVIKLSVIMEVRLHLKQLANVRVWQLVLYVMTTLA